MSIKLTDFLFEEDSKSIAIDDNIQSLSKSTIEKISAFLGNTINSKLPKEDKVPEDAKDKDLGVVSFSSLKMLSKVPIKGLYSSAMQVQGEQQPGLSQKDFR